MSEKKEQIRALIEQELKEIETFVLQLFREKPLWGGLIIDTLQGECRQVFYFFKKKYMIQYQKDHPCAILITFDNYINNNLKQQINTDLDNLHL